MREKYKWDNYEVGTCYYPEQWDKALWENDLDRMKNAGIETIRIAEFAWSKVEPKEGEFTFDFFMEFLDLCEKKEMKVIFGTPTATPPAWLTEKYPEVLNARKDGVLFRHGMRRHYNYNSPKYRELSSRIVEKIAQAYGNHKAIIGWQIDNELNCEVDEFYSESDSAAFRVFLKDKYGNLDALNNAWGTAFWNQGYNEWEEIFVPRTTVPGSNNPHQVLDYCRFVSKSAIDFCAMQVEILRKYIPESVYITTNGMFGNLDNHKMVKDVIDVYTYDSYPNFAYGIGTHPEKSTDLLDRKWSRNLSIVRSICPHFGVMEQQSGAGSWVSWAGSPSPRPGQLTLWAMQSIAHGADFMSFFRWRTAVFGTEMYWHGILDYDNKDNRKLAEVKKFGERLKAINEVCGADYIAEVGILRDYDNLFDARADRWHDRLLYEGEQAFFEACEMTHTPFDFVNLTDDTSVVELSKYKMLVYPHGVLLSDARIAVLKEYVKAGGKLLIGARTGQKDMDGHCRMVSMPGFDSEFCASYVKEYTFVREPLPTSFMVWDGEKIETGFFNDILDVCEEGKAKVLANYSDDEYISERGNAEKLYYAGAPALVETECGDGTILHFGGTFTRDNAIKFLEKMSVAEPCRDIVELADDVEVCVRKNAGNTYLFLLNYSSSPMKIVLKKELTDIETGIKKTGEEELAGYEVRVYKI